MPKDSFKTMLIMSWSLLFVCLIIKLFGGNYFEFEVTNPKFISFCNWVDTKPIIKMILACAICEITTLPIICILLNKPKLNLKENIIFSIFIMSSSLLSWHFQILSIIIQVIYLIIFPLIITKGNFKRIVLVNFLAFLMQLVSLLLRNLSINEFNSNNFILQTLIQIDYYIMVWLMYLYNFKERKNRKEE